MIRWGVGCGGYHYKLSHEYGIVTVLVTKIAKSRRSRGGFGHLETGSNLIG